MSRLRVDPALGGALALAVAMSIGRFAYTPLLPFMRDAHGLSTSAAGWLASANYAGYLVGAVTTAAAARRAGLRATMRIGLGVSAVTTALMAATSEPSGWAVLRFAAGWASAWAMIAAASLVFATSGTERRRTAAVMFTGVGGGIIVSTLVVAACAGVSDAPEPMWLVLGAVSVLGAVVADVLVGAVDEPPAPVARRARPIPLSPAVRRLVASYACAGFGYVVTATYLVLIVRESDLGRPLEFVTWIVVGLFAVPSTWCWSRLGDVLGDRPAIVVAHGALAVGVLAAVFVSGTIGVIVGGALLGGTFVGITGVGLDISRRMHPIDPTRAIAVMTSAFAVGQIVGPAVGGWLADRTGTFEAPSALAAGVLVVGGLILWAPIDAINPSPTESQHGERRAARPSEPVE